MPNNVSMQLEIVPLHAPSPSELMGWMGNHRLPLREEKCDVIIELGENALTGGASSKGEVLHPINAMGKYDRPGSWR